MRSDILKILYGNDFVPLKVRIPLLSFLKGFYKSLQVRKILKKDGLAKALLFIQTSAPTHRTHMFLTGIDRKNIIYNARRISHNGELLSVLLKRSRICLEQSLATATLLFYMGFPVTIYLGKIIISQNQYSFHAWVNVWDQNVTGELGERERYRVVYSKTF